MEWSKNTISRCCPFNIPRFMWSYLCQFFYSGEERSTRHGAGAKVDVSSGTVQISHLQNPSLNSLIWIKIVKSDNVNIWTWASYCCRSRVSSKWKKNNFGSNRNKPKQDLFRVCFGSFRETKNIFFRFVSVFRTYIETTETKRTVSKRTETIRKISQNTLYHRVAAIFLEHFQIFPVALKKSTFLLIILNITVSALCRSGNKNKQTRSGKDKSDQSTGSYENCHRLQASRHGRTMRKILPAIEPGGAHHQGPLQAHENPGAGDVHFSNKCIKNYGVGGLEGQIICYE